MSAPLPPSTVLLIPAHNEEHFLARAFAAILPQLAENRISKVVIVNDGSTDRTGEVAERLAKLHPFVEVIHHPQNRGKADAFLSGLRRARELGADHLVAVDADFHKVTPGAIKKMLQHLRKPNVKMVVGQYRTQDGGPYVKSAYSGHRAFRVSVFNPLFSGSKRWQVLKGSGYELETHLDGLLGRHSELADVVFTQRPEGRGDPETLSKIRQSIRAATLKATDRHDQLVAAKKRRRMPLDWRREQKKS